jgi:hypothetical protein
VICSPSTKRRTTTVSMPVLAAGAGWLAERTARAGTRDKYACRHAGKYAGRYAGGWWTR